jgi:DNA-directed RNA polymerase subunit M
MMICPGCKGLLYPQDDQLACRRCGHTQAKGAAQVVDHEREKQEQVVMDSIDGTLPRTTIICDKCGHGEATWVLRQTRAADEPATRIYQCTGCRHKWREY